MSNEWYVGTGSHSKHLHVTHLNEKVRLLMQIDDSSTEITLSIERTEALIDALKNAIEVAKGYLPDAAK